MGRHVYDVDPTINQRWHNVSCLLSRHEVEHWQLYLLLVKTLFPQTWARMTLQFRVILLNDDV